MTANGRPEAIPGFGEVNGRSHVWRYMSFEKFLALLQQSGLYFSRASGFLDNRDSTVPPRTIAALEARYEGSGLPGAKTASKIERYLSELAIVRQEYFVNCWSLRTSESYALWRIYLSRSDVGVAVQSTLARLRDSIKPPRELNGPIFWGKVQYRNFLDPDSLDAHRLLMTKSEAYSYEAELRLVVRDPLYAQCDENAASRSTGCLVPVDLDRLVKRVLVSPFAPSWFLPVVDDVLQRYASHLVARMAVSEIDEG